MSWEPAQHISRQSLSRRGLAGSLAAGQVCHEAERLYPGLFTARSLRNGMLSLEVSPENLLAVKLIEGELLNHLTRFGKANHLPAVTSLRLTPKEK